MTISNPSADQGQMTDENTAPDAVHTQRRPVRLIFDSSIVQRSTRRITPLIFDSLEVPRDALITGEVRLGHPAGKEYSIRAFSGPGDTHQRQVDAIEVTDTVVRFPNWGHWRFVAKFGVVKLLLLDPKLPSDDVPREVLSFVASNIWHCLNDHYLACADLHDRAFHFAELAEKFFNSDQPLGLHCGDATTFLCVIMDHLGYRTRIIALKGSVAGHMFPEVWLPDSQSWAILDPDYGVMLQYDDRWIDTQTMIELAMSGRSDKINVVDVANKRLPWGGTQVPTSFVGQLTWRPEFMDGGSAVKTYVKNVIQRQPMDLQIRSIVVTKEVAPTIGQRNSNLENKI